MFESRTITANDFAEHHIPHHFLYGTFYFFPVTVQCIQGVLAIGVQNLNILLQGRPNRFKIRIYVELASVAAKYFFYLIVYFAIYREMRI